MQEIMDIFIDRVGLISDIAWLVSLAYKVLSTAKEEKYDLTYIAKL